MQKKIKVRIVSKPNVLMHLGVFYYFQVQEKFLWFKYWADFSINSLVFESYIEAKNYFESNRILKKCELVE